LKKTRRPGILAARARSLAATCWVVTPPRCESGLRLMKSWPRFTDAFQLDVPIEEPTPDTAGSASTISVAFCCSSYIAWNEISADARVPPQIRPVSSCGK
jgi:hypothetical protein